MRCFAFTCALTFALASAAVAQTLDNWFWPSIEVQKKILGDLTLSANFEARINNNYSNLRGYFGELEAKWSFNKYLAVSGNYRFGGRQADVLTDYASSQRATLFVYGKIKFGKFSITNRAGVFRQYLEIRENPRDYLREKLTIKTDFFKKVNPLVYGEFFYRLDVEPARVEEWRLAGGVEYDISKRHSVKLLYMFAQQVNVKRPDARRTVILSYTWKLKSKKKESAPEIDSD